MNLKDLFSFENINNSPCLRNDFIFYSRADYNMILHLKDLGNKYIYNSLPENEEKNTNKESSFYSDINLLKLGNDSFFSSSEEKKEENNKNKVLVELEEDKEKIYDNSLKKNDFDIFISNYSSSDTSAEIKAKKSLQKIFKVIYPKKFSLFTKIELKKELLEAKKKVACINKKRRRNKEDDIRRMIGRRFFNDILYNKINDILKKEESTITFEKLQQDLIYDLVKKCHKKYLKLTLEEILTKKELYKGKNMEKYYHNIKALNQLRSEKYEEIRENTKIDFILNMRYYDLFQEYLSSNELVEEINRLKKNNIKFDDVYINNYIYYTFHFIENFSE